MDEIYFLFYFIKFIFIYFSYLWQWKLANIFLLRISCRSMWICNQYINVQDVPFYFLTIK